NLPKNKHRAVCFGQRIDPDRFPVAAANGLFDRPSSSEDDRVTSKLAALQVYQLAIPAPKQLSNLSTSPRAAARPCSMATPDAVNVTCHLCSQSPAGTRIRLRGFAPTASKPSYLSHRAARRIVFPSEGRLLQRRRFATLPDVVNHYDQCMNLGLSGDEKTDLVQYLLTLAEVLLVSVPAQIHKAYRQRPLQDTDVHLIRK